MLNDDKLLFVLILSCEVQTYTLVRRVKLHRPCKSQNRAAKLIFQLNKGEGNIHYKELNNANDVAETFLMSSASAVKGFEKTASF